MRIFALETDMNVIMERFCDSDECELLRTHFHGMSFALAMIQEVAITLVLLAVVILALWFGWAPGWVAAIAGLIFLLFVVPTTLKAYLDWKFDAIIITSDKVILIDQTSFFHNEIKPIQYDNVGSVSSSTQWWGLFTFGQITISLKEGEGGGMIVKRYVPNAREVAGKMTEAVTKYQRRAYGHGEAVEQ